MSSLAQKLFDRTVVVLFVGVGIWYLALYVYPQNGSAILQTPAYTQTATTTGTVPDAGFSATSTTTIPSGKTFTLAEVASHNTVKSCYSAIEGSVYDLTTWVFAHPGGARRIQMICGTDATAAFEEQHGGDSRPEQILATFKIGTLVK